MMDDFWTAPKIWPGRTVFIIGGGPSLKGFDWDRIKSERLIGCNDAYMLGEWVDVCVFGDAYWFSIHNKEWVVLPDKGKVPGLKQYGGLKVTCHPNFIGGMPGLKCMNRKTYGFGFRPNQLAWNMNTGSPAINLAYHFGASKIILLGFDMKLDKDGNSNWHLNLTAKPNAKMYPKFMDFLKLMAEVIKKELVNFEVLNANPESEMDLFPKVRLENVI